MREYHYEIKYVQGKYNYVADQLSRPVRIVQRCPTTTILGLTSAEFVKCQREEVKWREMVEYGEEAIYNGRLYSADFSTIWLMT